MGHLCPPPDKSPPKTEGTSDKNRGKRWRESNLVPDIMYASGSSCAWITLNDLPRAFHSRESQYKLKDPENILFSLHLSFLLQSQNLVLDEIFNICSADAD